MDTRGPVNKWLLGRGRAIIEAFEEEDLSSKDLTQLNGVVVSDDGGENRIFSI
jgi:hypothetical protein